MVGLNTQNIEKIMRKQRVRKMQYQEVEIVQKVNEKVVRVFLF
jgi:hypothetical protein